MRVRRHITPPLYYDYLDLKKKHGAEAAKQIIQSRLDTSDVFFDKDVGTLLGGAAE